MERLQLENVQILFKNFNGTKGQFNEAGNRNFSILIDDMDLAERLIAQGWALKPLKDDEGNTEAYHLPVRVNYGGRVAPRIYKVSESNRSSVLLEEKTVGVLDYLPIDRADILLNPYEWEVRGERGVKAYCQTAYMVIEESELDLKWAEFQAHSDDVM